MYCAISGYGRDGPYTARSGHDMNYLGSTGCSASPATPAAAGAVRRTDRRPGRWRADGGLGILAALRERETSGRGPVGGRVDVRRLAVVAGHGGRQVPVRRRRAAAGRQRAERQAHLLPPLRLRRRLGHAGCARAQVLAGLVSRGWARGPDRAPVRAARPTRTRRSSASSPSARASSGTSSPRSTTAASSRYWTSTRRSTRSSSARARWWCRSTSPERTARLLGVPVALAHTGRARRLRPCPGRAHAGGAHRSGSVRRRDRRTEREGAVA